MSEKGKIRSLISRNSVHSAGFFALGVFVAVPVIFALLRVTVTPLMKEVVSPWLRETARVHGLSASWMHLLLTVGVGAAMAAILFIVLLFSDGQRHKLSQELEIQTTRIGTARKALKGAIDVLDATETAIQQAKKRHDELDLSLSEMETATSTEANRLRAILNATASVHWWRKHTTGIVIGVIGSIIAALILSVFGMAPQ